MAVVALTIVLTLTEWQSSIVKMPIRQVASVAMPERQIDTARSMSAVMAAGRWWWVRGKHQNGDNVFNPK